MRIFKVLSLLVVAMLLFATPLFAQAPVVTDEPLQPPVVATVAPVPAAPGQPAAAPEITEEAIAPVVTEQPAAPAPAAPGQPAAPPQVTEEAVAPVVPEEPTVVPAAVAPEITEEAIAPVVPEDVVPVEAAPAAAPVGAATGVEGQGPPGNWSSDVNLINLDTAGAASIVVKRYGQWAGSGAADPGTDINVAGATCTLPIPAGGSCYFNPAQMTGYPTGAGAIVVTSDRNLAAASTVANSSFGTTAYASDAYSGLGQDGVSTDVFLPIIMGNYATVWNTRIAVQNAGTVAADVTITYIGAGAPLPTTVTGLPPGMMALVDQNTASFTNFNGSAVLHSAQPLAAVVDEYKSVGGVLVTYTGLPVAKASQTVYLPGYINQTVWATDFTIVNVDPANAATISVAFAGSAATLSGPVGANAAQYVNLLQGLPAGWTGGGPASPYYGAATITSNRNIVVVYNIANSNPPGNGQHALAYVGTGATGAGTKVNVPIVENLYTAGWTTTFSAQTTDGSEANLSLVYGGNLAASCNPCAVTTTSGRVTVNHASAGHVPVGFLGGVTITSNKNIVVIADQDLPGGLGDTAAGFPGIKLQ